MCTSRLGRLRALAHGFSPPEIRVLASKRIENHAFRIAHGRHDPPTKTAPRPGTVTQTLRHVRSVEPVYAGRGDFTAVFGDEQRVFSLAHEGVRLLFENGVAFDDVSLFESAQRHVGP